MSTARNLPETGNRAQEYWFIREGETGERIADPEWKYFSNNAREFNWSPDYNKTRQEGLGSAYGNQHFNGNEAHELDFVYDLQRPLIDTAGNRDDPSVDALQRTADGNIAHTHAVLGYESRGAVPDDPADTDGARTFSVAKGGHPDVEGEGDPEEGQPIPITMSYMFEKVRSYLIYQPAASTLLLVESSSANDTTQSITIEDKGATTSETIALNGTTAVSSSSEFTNIFGAHLDAECEGDVSIFINDGTAASPAKGVELTASPIRGSLHYSNTTQPVEGDLGVPALGTGSEPTELAFTDYEHFRSAEMTWGTTGALKPWLNNITFESGNGWEQIALQGTTRFAIVEGNAEPTVTAEVIGPDASHDALSNAAGEEANDLTLTMSRTEITWQSASLIDGAMRERDASGDVVPVESTFEPAGDDPITVTNVE